MGIWRPMPPWCWPGPRACARLLAEKLAGRIAKLPDVTGWRSPGRGSINLHLADSYRQARIADVLAAGTDYGSSKVGAGRRVNVEYVSANPDRAAPHRPCPGAVYGDALALLLGKAGFEVTREYYINDAGAQVDTLARSTHLRYLEALGETIDQIPRASIRGLSEGGRPGPGGAGRRQMARPAGGEWLAPVRRFAIDMIMAGIREDLRCLDRAGSLQLRARDDRSRRRRAALKTLEDRGLIYIGTLEPPKGKAPEDREPRPQTLFRATEFGDDVDRPLKKSDGSWTYFAGDIAYHYDKFRRGTPEMIDVWGADHAGYIKRMKAAVTGVTGGAGSLDVKVCQLVRLLRDGSRSRCRSGPAPSSPCARWWRRSARACCASSC